MALKQTYRSCVEGLKVAPGDHRGYGELVPEAANWENPGPYLREGIIEKVTVDRKEFDEFVAAHPPFVDPINRGKKPAAKKTVIRKKASNGRQQEARKRIVVKRHRSQGRRIAEQSV